MSYADVAPSRNKGYHHHHHGHGSSFITRNPGSFKRIPSKPQRAPLCSDPYTPHMAELLKRIMTYQGWPNHIKASPKQLSEAGFFYTGEKDNVKCFNCNGCLGSWNPEEDPWREHAKWFPRCEYLHKCKGQQFVEDIVSSDPFLQRPSIVNPVPWSCPALSNGSSTDSDYVTTLHQSIRSKDEEIKEAMMTDAVIAVKMLGFEEDVIRKLVKKKIEEGGKYEYASELVTDLQAEEKNQVIDDDATMDWTSSPSSSSSFSSSSSSSPSSSSFSSPSSSSSSSPSSPTNSETSSFFSSTSFNSKNLQTLKPQSPPKTPAPAGLVLMSEPSAHAVPSIHSQLADGSKHEIERDPDSDRKFPDEETCKVCLDKRTDSLLLPCKHICCCIGCASALKCCPICRRKIETILKIYRK